MACGHEMFSVKLRELEQEYGRMWSRIQLFQEQGPQRIRQELERVQEEYQEQNLLLEEAARASRSPAAARLAGMQREYERQVEQILHQELPKEMQGRKSAPAEAEAEALSLYAEYAMDSATQAMRRAVIAALTAMERQENLEQNQEQGGMGEHE